jgi:hypothetical protein
MTIWVWVEIICHLSMTNLDNSNRDRADNSSREEMMKINMQWENLYIIKEFSSNLLDLHNHQLRQLKIREDKVDFRHFQDKGSELEEEIDYN